MLPNQEKKCSDLSGRYIVKFRYESLGMFAAGELVRSSLKLVSVSFFFFFCRS